MKVLISTVLSVLLTLSFSTNANLITNGSFEDNNVASGKWRVFDSSAVNGWQGSNIEIWNNLNGVSASHGLNIIELNAHGGGGDLFSIFQEVETIAGRSYELSFDYAARRNANESFLVEIFSGQDSIFSAILDDHNVSQWSEFNTLFVATDANTTIEFTTTSASTLGNLIDNVALKVSSPGTALIAGLALVLLCARRFTLRS